MSNPHKQLLSDVLHSYSVDDLRQLASHHRKLLEILLKHLPNRSAALVALHQTAREGVAKDILQFREISSAVGERFARRLVQQTGLQMDWALWAIQTWASAASIQLNWQRSIVYQPVQRPKESGKPFQYPTAKVVELQGHRKALTDIQFSPNGKWLATSSIDRSIRLWESKTGRLLASFLGGHRDWIRCIAYQPDGLQLGSGGDDGSIRIWDMKTGQKKQALKGHHGFVHAMAFSFDGNLVASGGSDGVLCIWQVDNMELVLRLGPLMSPISSVTFSYDGQWVAVGYAGHVEVWELRTQKRILQKTYRGERITVLALPSDELLIASAQGVEKMTPLSTQSSLYFMGHEGPVWGMSKDDFSPSLVTFGEDRTLRLWDSTTGQMMWKMDLKQNINAVTLSREGRLAIALSNPKALLWQLERM